MEPDLESGYDIERLRKQLPILAECLYFNTGTVGIMAEPVLERHLDNIADHERGGHASQRRAIEGYEQARSAIADLVGAERKSVALNRNATDGINWIAGGFPLQPGDEVITSDQEHPAMIYPLLAACQRAGATLRFVRLTHDVDQLDSYLTEAVNARTRLISFSHVSCETGTRVPVEQIRRIVGSDVRILVDASQSVGQFDVKVGGLNADFVIGNGHKWLAGPKGSGFAWFADDALELVPPAYFGDGAVTPQWSRSHYQANPLPRLAYACDASRFEFGTRAWHTYGALSDAIDYLRGIGWQSIFDHVGRITTFMKATLNEIPGVDVMTPERWEDSSGLVTFTIAGLNGLSVSERLWSEGIAQRSVEVPSAVRVSCTYFTNEEDVTRLSQVVDRIARGT